MTEAQRAFLSWLPVGGEFRMVHIDRSGRQLDAAPARQQCRRKGWAENDDQVNGGGRSASRFWRLTDAGRAALEQTS